ncbi:MAG: hypothetical protein HUJ89_02565 [Bacteroidales bacterium]|nr:hypothetical protein [Bacteroidales bacterium]
MENLEKVTGYAQKESYEKPALVTFEIQSEGVFAKSGRLQDIEEVDW